MNIIKNILFLGLISIISSINGDTDLKRYKKDSPINKLQSNGDNIGHMFAKECQTINSEEEAIKKVMELCTKYFKNGIKDINRDDSNPFISNKEGKGPRELSKETFKKTGSLNCLHISNKFREMEKNLVNELVIKK